ncbi:hypothetical protein BN7_284 [Wickerhamomyces ciferrii]|uniref:Uncharacterized protein n=1 Tax=Wickerhamomyces ciferrii (strain ATCC 14091 / BCRC 22168 / CBS 111 / JCM 3599 / NBRC 0793 / NRRL Y-1031 F-60-10) TaxID=1206466 RepID=K0K7F5_WICCF|nr:uncharacterized protein BN7_284 [Wickerhamomyces ciferrii]CCH40750.1 hypothetical protein BN7_284 [Wickerhamomyces ciferrii]
MPGFSSLFTDSNDEFEGLDVHFRGSRDHNQISKGFFPEYRTKWVLKSNISTHHFKLYSSDSNTNDYKIPSVIYAGTSACRHGLSSKNGKTNGTANSQERIPMGSIVGEISIIDELKLDRKNVIGTFKVESKVVKMFEDVPDKEFSIEITIKTDHIFAQDIDARSTRMSKKALRMKHKLFQDLSMNYLLSTRRGQLSFAREEGIEPMIN